MKKEKSAKHLFEMRHNETQEIIEKRRSDKDSLVSPIQFSRFAKHCFNCKECETEARKIGFLVPDKS